MYCRDDAHDDRGRAAGHDLCGAAPGRRVALVPQARLRRREARWLAQAEDEKPQDDGHSRAAKAEHKDRCGPLEALLGFRGGFIVVARDCQREYMTMIR